MPNTTFDMQLQDLFTGESLIAAGGKVIVCTAGSTRKAVLLNPDAGFAALANPLTPVKGKIRFAVANVANASPGSTSVDLYGMAAGGRGFVFRGAFAGRPTEVPVSLNARTSSIVVPFALLDTVAAAETNTGMDFPVGCLIGHPTILTVKTLEATRTLDVGLLSSQTGGDADGFIALASLAAVGTVKPTLNGTPTIGALLRATSGAAVVPECALIALATRLTYTLSAGTTVADGFITVPYLLPA